MRRDEVFSAVVAVLLGAVIGTGVVRVHNERRATASTMAALVLPMEVKRVLDASADRTLYIQDMGWFLTASYYEPDAGVRARLALVYSSGEELRWDRHDTMSLTAMHLQHFTGFWIVPYETVRGLQESVFLC